MKKITSTLIAATALASTMMAASVTAVKVNADISKISYSDDVWKSAKFSEVTLYPQTTIKLNDKNANELNAENSAKVAKVAAIYNKSSVAFMVAWPDGTANVQTGYKTTSFGDGFAIQIPSNSSDVTKLPYIGMGSEGRPVAVYLQKAVNNFYEPNGNGNVYYQLNRNQTELFDKDLSTFDAKVKGIGNNDYERAFVSEGFRSMTEIKDAGKYNSYSRLNYNNEGVKGWMGTLSRPIKDDNADLSSGVFPIAVATWDGAKMGRDGIKYLSSWVAVSFEGKDASALEAVTDEKVVGDAAAGKEAVSMNGCIGCHKVEATDPDNFMGPALTNIGGYATASYIRESLMNPSAVVVPGYNRNAHSNYMWYTLEDGKRVSAMTDYSWLDADSVKNIVSYLQTLKAEVK
jgi:complex iron-sulfur molybdoenzyme family reductase subunit gamma